MLPLSSMRCARWAVETYLRPHIRCGMLRQWLLPSSEALQSDAAQSRPAGFDANTSKPCATIGSGRAAPVRKRPDMFKTILVPIDVDDIETAEPALAQAVATAQGSEASLRLIHVRSDIPRSVMEFVPP